jgi:hypothetical protein
VNDINLTVNELVLHSNNETVLKSLVAETWNSLVLDCGTTSTVCGKKWFEEYQSSLSADEHAKIKVSSSSKSYRFGDSQAYPASKNAIIPALFGDVSVMISTDIVDADIPLLFSKAAMKKGKMQLNCDQDLLLAFNQQLPLNTTTNGLYALPITKKQMFISKFEHEDSNTHVVLKAVTVKSDEEIATKLHRCFAHPSADRLIRLINSAGAEWSNNTNLKNEIHKVSSSCDVCKVYKKPPPRPVVGLPMATNFQQVVAMDLKDYGGSHILHLVDLCTRLSAAIFIPNKKKETIVDALFKIWISVYGPADQFLSDNGGEFVNSDFISLCDQFGIVVKTTAAESPWSNGVVERNNQTIARSMDKVIADTGCKPEFALMWALNAKNSLQNVAGFSPYQLVLGRNPRMPSLTSDHRREDHTLDSRHT